MRLYSAARNAAVAMGNSGNPALVRPVEELIERETDPLVAEHLRWALGRLADA